MKKLLSLLLLTFTFFAINLAHAVEEKNLNDGTVDVTRSLDSHWHKPSLEMRETTSTGLRPTLTPTWHPAERKVIYTKTDRVNNPCQQVYMYDLDTQEEVQLTFSCQAYGVSGPTTEAYFNGQKSEPSWGMYIPSLTVRECTLPGWIGPHDQPNNSYNSSNAPVVCPAANIQTRTLSGWAVVYLRVVSSSASSTTPASDCRNGCQVAMKIIGPSLNPTDVENYVRTSPEIPLTNYRLISATNTSLGASQFTNPDLRVYQTQPQMRPILGARTGSNYQVAFVRHNDPTSSDRDMIYSVSFGGDVPVDLSTRTFYGDPLPYTTETNLTYRHSGNCGTRLPAYDFNSPQWFMDGLNLTFSVIDGTGFSQIGVVNHQESQTPRATGTNVPPLRAFSCGADAGSSITADTTSLRILTTEAIHHELPQPSLPLGMVANYAEYGIVFQRRDANNSTSLGAMSVLKETPASAGNSATSFVTSIRGLEQIVSAHAEERIGFSDTVNRRHPVWSPAFQGRNGWIAYEREESNGTQNIFGTEVILTQAPTPVPPPRDNPPPVTIVPPPTTGTTVPPVDGDPDPDGIPDAAPPVITINPFGVASGGTPGVTGFGRTAVIGGQGYTTEYRWTRCPDTHFWPEFQPTYVISATGNLMAPTTPTDIVYGKLVLAEEDHQVTHLFNLPQELENTSCAVIPNPPPVQSPGVPPAECLTTGGTTQKLNLSIDDVLRSQSGPIEIRDASGTVLTMDKGKIIGKCVSAQAGVGIKGSSLFGASSWFELLSLGIMAVILGYGFKRRFI